MRKWRARYINQLLEVSGHRIVSYVCTVQWGQKLYQNSFTNYNVHTYVHDFISPYFKFSKRVSLYSWYWYQFCMTDYLIRRQELKNSGSHCAKKWQSEYVVFRVGLLSKRKTKSTTWRSFEIAYSRLEFRQSLI